MSDIQKRFEAQQASLIADLTLLTKAMKMAMSLPYEVRDHAQLAFLRKELDQKSLALATLQGVMLGQPQPHQLGFAQADEILRPSNIDLTTNEVITLWVDGGLGDVLCITPTLRALKQQNEHCFIRLLLSNRTAAELFKGSAYVDELIFEDDAKHTYAQQAIKVSVGMLGTDLFYRQHASEILAGYLGVPISDIRPSYLVSAAEHERAAKLTANTPKLIILNNTSRSPKNKDWPLERYQELMAKLPDYQFAQIGLPDEAAIEGALDWRTSDSIRINMAQLSHAKAYVGMDTFWAHGAAALGIPAVVFFGSTRPEVFAYPNNVNLFTQASCSPCHSTLGDSPCPYGVACMHDISVAMCQQALLSLL